jgi:hypothetical protein
MVSDDKAASKWKKLWRRGMPFSLFRDAGRGTEAQRIANYRYNRSRRGVLPFFIFKWIGMAFSLMMLLNLFSAAIAATLEGSLAHLCAITLCLGTGIAFSVSCVMIAIMSVSYLYLCRMER